jgi:superfamily I DNA/RNA helicase
MQLIDANGDHSVLSPSHWGLNALQQAFFLEDGHCLCVACPGAGKTRTVIAKVARLSNEWGASSVMTITFTRAGAQELRERLAQALGPTVAKPIKAFTFHSLAYRQLSSRQSVQLVNAADQYGLLARARERVESKYSLEKLNEVISAYKRRLRVDPPDEASEEFEAYQVYLEYQRTMAAHGVMDMDDLMLTCLRGYQSGSLKPYPVRAMLVDEFQDVDEIQFNLILEYAKRGTQIHVVGDDDQSIYGFRAGLGYQGMRRFQRELNARVYFLDTNYRCAPAIVCVANQLIQSNRDRMDKQLLSGSTASGAPALRSYESSFDEADAVVDQYNTSPGTTFTMAVLARTNNWLDTIELAAISRGVRVNRVGDLGFLHRKHVSNVISAIKYGLNPGDRLALLSSLHGSGLSVQGAATLEDRLAGLDGRGQLVEVLYEIDVVASLDKQDATFLREFRVTMADWVSACHDMGATKGREPEGGLNGPLRELLHYFMNRSKNDWRRNDVVTLMRIMTERLSGALRQRLKTLDGWTRRSKRDEEADHHALTLMTVHSAKGLEFDSVWVAGCNERVFPYEGCDIEEERRLFYVALTRARTGLTVSYVVENKREPSRFVWETGLSPTAPEGQST